MIEKNYKLYIYKGMIQFLLDSTHYSLKTIADLSHSSITNIQSIYCDNYLPPNFSSELELVKIYQVVLELEINKKIAAKYVSWPIQ